MSTRWSWARGQRDSLPATPSRRLVWSQLNPFASQPRNVEEYFYKTRGRLLTRVASQAFQEKLAGRKWADIPMPPNFSNGNAGFLSTVKDAMRRVMTTQDINTYKGI